MTQSLKRALLNYLLQLSIFSTTNLLAQNVFYNDNPVNWSEFKNVNISAAEKYSSDAPLTIIDDNTEFRFFENNRGLSRLLTIKINNEKGLAAISEFRVPESFDFAFDVDLKKQGRLKNRRVPYIRDFSIKKFSCRKHVNNHWEQQKFKNKYQKIRWITYDGSFSDDDFLVFQPVNFQVGDVIQIFYEADYKGSYDADLFYFYSIYPKIRTEFTFIYQVDKHFSDYKFILPLNISDSLLKSTVVTSGDKITVTKRIVLNNIEAINYPANAFEAKTLPHVYVDLDFFRVLTESVPDNGARRNTYQLVKPKNFEWIIIKDTSYSYTKIYDKYFAGIRKFVKTLPPLTPDSNNLTFYKAFCDTINSFRYLTQNHIYYNESNLMDVSTMDHVNRRRLVGSAEKLCRDILNDNNIFYYRANIQDRRFGEHSPYYRVHYAYERELIAIPYQKTYLYFLPRPNGVAYHVNELPFYLEGSLASLFPMNLQEKDTLKALKFFKFIKTHRGTFNENTRTENATIKIDFSRGTAEYSGKESLSGQFSTLLRHKYLNEIIDSTMSPHYFVRSVDKPGASEIKIRLSSKITDFPFRYNFICTNKMAIKDGALLNISKWFSFPISTQALPEMPNHDYYFDFDFSDVYNFKLDFSSPVEIKNSAAFLKKINNPYFELNSEILSQGENSALIQVKLVVKTTSIPKKDLSLLQDLIKELEELNSFTLQLKR